MSGTGKEGAQRLPYEGRGSVGGRGRLLAPPEYPMGVRVRPASAACAASEGRDNESEAREKVECGRRLGDRLDEVGRRGRAPEIQSSEEVYPSGEARQFHGKHCGAGR